MNSGSLPQGHSYLGIDQCIENVRFFRATEMARSGKYLEAEALLAPKGETPDIARELDLLARISAHQERFDDAARYWLAALKKDPTNADYQLCFKQISDFQQDKELLDRECNTAFQVFIGVILRHRQTLFLVYVSILIVLTAYLLFQIFAHHPHK